MPRPTAAQVHQAVIELYRWELASLDEFEYRPMVMADIEAVTNTDVIGVMQELLAEDADAYNFVHTVVERILTLVMATDDEIRDMENAGELVV